jgi:phosphatidylglycerol:prolipoprotein diacylglycerol transferase
MVPYFTWSQIHLGPVTLQVWGLFVAAGILLAAWVGRREAVRRGLDGDRFLDLAMWLLVPAFVVARLAHVFAYAPDAYLGDPVRIFKVWEGGLSSFGGFVGAGLGLLAYWRRHRAALAGSAAGYMEAAAYALPLGYGCGRIGCFLIHDHPGTLSDSLFAVQYPGGARLDHGLLLSLLGFAIFGVFLLLRKRVRGEGLVFLPLFLLLYGAVRFVLDLFRASDLVGSDARYLGLTPAQYGCVAFVAVGAALFAWQRRRAVPAAR